MSGTGQNPEPRPVKPANKRGAARLAAVQALYQMEVGGTGLLEVVAEYEAHRLGGVIDGETYRDADAAWFRDVVSGVVRGQTAIDPLIHASLPADWPLSRIDTTLRAILRAGTHELSARKDVPVAVIVTEYVDVAKAFYSDDEPGLVNAVLDRVARAERGEGRGQPVGDQDPSHGAHAPRPAAVAGARRKRSSDAAVVEHRTLGSQGPPGTGRRLTAGRCRPAVGWTPHFGDARAAALIHLTDPTAHRDASAQASSLRPL